MGGLGRSIFGAENFAVRQKHESILWLIPSLSWGLPLVLLFRQGVATSVADRWISIKIAYRVPNLGLFNIEHFRTRQY